MIDKLLILIFEIEFPTIEALAENIFFDWSVLVFRDDRYHLKNIVVRPELANANDSAF